MIINSKNKIILINVYKGLIILIKVYIYIYIPILKVHY